MRKSMWVVVLFVAAVVGAPSAHADSFADVSFTCAASCTSVPTDPLVSFPSPTIPINFFSQQFNMTLNSLDKSSDKYSWEVDWTDSSWFFVINDITNGLRDSGPGFSFDLFGKPHGDGDVNFDCVSAPEPSSASLCFVGLGIALLGWKFRERSGRASVNSAV
jgi:hypothetical protein